MSMLATWVPRCGAVFLAAMACQHGGVAPASVHGPGRESLLASIQLATATYERFLEDRARNEEERECYRRTRLRVKVEQTARGGFVDFEPLSACCGEMAFGFCGGARLTIETDESGVPRVVLISMFQ